MISQPDLFTTEFLLILFKVGILIILVLYAIFAILIVRQVELMTRTLMTPLSDAVKAISLIHAAFAVGFVILTLFLL